MFREESLKKQQESLVEDELLTIPPTHNSLGIYFLMGVLALAVYWLFFGAITVNIEGKGIFINQKGLSSVQTQSSGFVTEILVNPGDIVKKDDPLIVLSNEQEDIALKYANQQLSSLEEFYQKLKERYAKEEKVIKEGVQKQIESNRIKIEKMEKEIPILENDFTKKQSLLKEGLVSTSTVLDAENLLFQMRTALEKAKATIAKLQANLKKSYNEEELKSLEQRILNQQEATNLLKLNKQYNQLSAPFDAHILEVLVRIGEPVSSGKNVLWIEAAEHGVEDVVVYAFLNPNLGARVSIGQQIYVQPANINAQEYGSIIGHITAISPTMLSSEQVATLIHDKGLQEYLQGGVNTPYLVTIKPEPDSSMVSGYRWTSETGLPFKITSGVVANISGVAYYERPIVRLFPLWRLDVIVDDIGNLFNSKEAK